MDSSVPRVPSTVSTAGMASRNMGEGSNHEDDSPGQGHSDGKHPGFGVPDRGNTGNSRADHVSDTNAGARVCMSKGPYPEGNRCGSISDNYAEEGHISMNGYAV